MSSCGRTLNNPMAMSRPVTIAPPRGVFSLSFDDFPASAWTEAGPVLAEHGVKATYYVCGGLAGGVNMDRDQFQVPHLQALHAAGHEVGGPREAFAEAFGALAREDRH